VSNTSKIPNPRCFRLNTPLTLHICICSTTTTEAAENQARLLQEQTTELLQSNNAQSILLRDLISRQQALENILAGSAGSTPPSTAGSHPSDHCGSSDNASIMSKRSTLSFRLGRPDYLEDLKESRAYKRLRHFGRGIDIDSGAESVFSSDSSGSTGNWSMLSDMTLGDLSVSQIAVLNLPIDLADVSNPEPFQGQFSIDGSPNSRGKRSSRGRIHNAIENGNGFVVRTLLSMGMDVEERDSNGRTPLIHAAMKRQEAICKLLLEKGASVEALKALTSGMDLKEKSELLDQPLQSAMNEGFRSETALRLLLLMALGGDDNRSSSLVNVAIDLKYGLAACAIAQLELRVLTERRAPFTRITELVFGSTSDINYEALKDICKVLLDNINIVIESMKNLANTRIAVSMHTVVSGGYKSILQFLSLIESRDSEGWTPLASAAFNLNEALCQFLVENGCSLCLDTEQKNQLKPKLSLCVINAARGGHETALQLLLDMGADINERNSPGETALLEAVYYNHLSCVKILLERGADATILTNGGSSVLHYATLKLIDSEMMKFLLDVVETRKLVHMKDSGGNTALHDCIYSGSPIIGLEKAKMLVQAGASLTIKNSGGKTPYEYARFGKKKELAKYLWSQLSPEQQAQQKPPPSD